MRTKYIFIILIACLWGCKGTKNVVADKTNSNTNKVGENLAKSTTNGDGLVTQDECLPQDKPFLDSIRAGEFVRKTSYGSYDFYRSIDSVPDYFKKILPGAILYEVGHVGAREGTNMAYFNGVHYSIGKFNFLYKAIHNSDINSALGKFKCVLFIAYGAKYNLTEFKEEHGTIAQFNDRYQYVANVSGFTFYINYESFEFGNIYLFEGKTLSSLWGFAKTK